MKRITYQFLSAEINRGTEEKPNVERIFLTKHITWSKESEEAAKREAHNGEYTIEEVEDAEAL